jgi:hypothetical protein
VIRSAEDRSGTSESEWPNHWMQLGHQCFCSVVVFNVQGSLGSPNLVMVHINDHGKGQLFSFSL